MCDVNPDLKTKRLGHRLQEYGLIPVCRIRCLLRFSLVLNDFPHSGHRYGLKIL